MISLKIETLLEGKVVERNRVEYKKGWNPEDVIHTICAFANDYSNVNGGYIVIGIEEVDGVPALPPAGLRKNQLDKVQKEIFEYCHLIEPYYIPQIEICDYPDEHTHLIYMKCSAGDSGPYTAPKAAYKDPQKRIDKTRHYWIRPASVTTAAKPEEIAELYEKFNSVPFDDRIHRTAGIDVIRRGYVEDFLRDSKSSLVSEINRMTLEDILVSLEVANETDEGIVLRNIGVLMFADRPDKLIPGAYINYVRFFDEDREGADSFEEKEFRGPIWKQVRDVLDHLNTTVITERVTKIDGQAESVRHFNYPYNALEEAIVNAVFHKSYREDVPVDVRVYYDEIVIINFPGPAQYINMKDFANGRARSRKYRNRRIGEFFKELDLSEKQSTGIFKILKALRENGSPLPEFKVDENRTFMEITIRARDEESADKTTKSADKTTKSADKITKSADKMTQSADNADRTMMEGALEDGKKRIMSAERYRQVMEWMRPGKEYSTREVADYLGLKEPRTRQILNEMADDGKLQRLGGIKDRRYKISDGWLHGACEFDRARNSTAG